MTRDADGKRVKILYIEPTRIDFPALAADARAHGLEVSDFRLRASGVVVERRCEVCIARRRFLRLKGTGQEFELSPARSQPGDEVLMDGEISRWTNGRHLRLSAHGETKQN